MALTTPGPTNKTYTSVAVPMPVECEMARISRVIIIGGSACMINRGSIMSPITAHMMNGIRPIASRAE